MDQDRERRLALNEAVARDVNERVESVASGWHDPEEQIQLICECSNESCSERIHVTSVEYHEVREHEDRFMVIDAHVNEEIERRVGTVGDATVVEKIGEGRDVARSTAE